MDETLENSPVSSFQASHAFTDKSPGTLICLEQVSKGRYKMIEIVSNWEIIVMCYGNLLDVARSPASLAR